MSLDSYLEGLTKEAEQERVEKVYLKTASDEELMSLAGFEKTALKPSVSAMEDRLGVLLRDADRQKQAGKTKEAKIPRVLRDTAIGGVAGRIDLERAKEKKASVLKVGDQAGRLLAKMAQGEPGGFRLEGSEIQEALADARAREDIAGRAKKWQTAGGALGAGIGAGSGGALTNLISRAAGATPRTRAVATGLGAAGMGLAGGLAGARIGKREGTEEALADKIVAMARARRNQQMGAMQGYMAAQRPFPVER